MTKKKIAIVSSVGAGVLIIGAIIAWLFVSGRVAFVVNQDGPVETLKRPAVQVCGDTVVDEYNTAYDTIVHNIVTEQLADGNISAGGPDYATIIALAGDIKRKNSWAQDPTCQTLVFWAAVFEQDYEAAKSAHQAVRELHDKGFFADNDIRDNTPLNTWEGQVWALSPEALSEDPGVE